MSSKRSGYQLNRSMPLIGIATIFAFALTGCHLFSPDTVSDLEAYQEYFKARKALEDGDFNLADQTCLKALKLMDKCDHDPKMVLLLTEAEIKMQKADYPAVIKYCDLGLPLLSQQKGRDNTSYASALAMKPLAYMRMGQFAKAEPLFYEALAIYDRLGGAQKNDSQLHGEYKRMVTSLCVTLAANDNEAEAKAMTKELLIEDGNEDPSTFDVNMQLANFLAYDGEFLYKRGRWKEARPLFERSIKVYGDFFRRGPKHNGRKTIYTPTEEVTMGMRYLANIYAKSGKGAAAKKLKKQARDWDAIRNSLPDPREDEEESDE